MNINLMDVITHANAFSNQMLITELKKDNNFSVSELNKINSSSMLASDYSYTIICNLILGAIDGYHEQLREKIKEVSSFDIGAVTFD